MTVLINIHHLNLSGNFVSHHNQLQIQNQWCHHDKLQGSSQTVIYTFHQKVLEEHCLSMNTVRIQRSLTLFTMFCVDQWNLFLTFVLKLGWKKEKEDGWENRLFLKLFLFLCCCCCCGPYVIQTLSVQAFLWGFVSFFLSLTKNQSVKKWYRSDLLKEKTL